MSVILCTAGYDHTIRFWEALSGICSRTISHPESQINRLCISPDKRFLAAAGAQDIKLYDIRSTNPAPILVFKGHTTNVTAVAFHCEGKWMVTGSEDKTVKIWDTRSGTVQRDYAHDFPVTDVVIHPNQGEIISVDRGGLLRIWDLGENECVHRLQPTGPQQKEDLPLTSVTVATDGSLLCAANTAGMVFVWRLIQDQDSTTIAPVTSYFAHNTYITRILLSPDSRHLATCSSDHFARIWRVSETLVYGTHFNAEAASRSSSTVGTANGSRTDTSKSSSNSNDTPSSTFTMDSIPLTPGEPNLEIPADIASLPRPANAFPLESELLSHQRWVWDCAFSADSAYLVTASSDHYARLFELSTGGVIRQYTGHHRSCVCVALNDYSEAR